MSTPADAPFSLRDVLAIRDYRWLWFGQIVSTFGDSLTMLALILLINKLSNQSPAAIATLMAIIALPTVVVGVFAGALVDRWPRKQTLMVCDAVRTVLVLGFVGISMMSAPPLWIIYTIAFLEAAVGTFFNPARMAIIPSLVPERGLMSANSLGQMSRVLFSVIGTAAAGFLIGSTGLYPIVFTVDAITFLLSVLFISRVAYDDSADLKQKSTVAAPSLGAIFSELRRETAAGFILIRGNAIILGAMISMSITMFGLGAVNVMLPPFIVNDLQVNETWFGAVELAQSAAMILSGLMVGWLAARFRPTRIISVTLFLTGLLTIALYPVNSIWTMFPVLFGFGLVMTPLQAAASTLIQTNVEREVLGRVAAALNAVVQIASLLSMFLAGVAGETLGLRNVFLISGAITILASIIAAALFARSGEKG